MIKPGSIAGLLLACLLIKVGAFAQVYSYKRYTVDDGLPTNAVYGCMQDSRGYIWFYTEKGISRFDGYQFFNYTVKDGLPTNDIFYLDEDQLGRLWLHSFAEDLVVMDVERDSFFSIATKRANSFPFDIISNENKVWGIDHSSSTKIFSIGSPKSNRMDTLALPKKARSKYARQFGEDFQNSMLYYYQPSQFIRFNKRSLKATRYDIVKGEVLDEFYFKNLSEQEVDKLAKNTFQSYQPYKNGVYTIAPKDSIVYYLDFVQKVAHKINLLGHLNKLPGIVRFHLQKEQLQIQTNTGLIVVEDINKVRDVFCPEMSGRIQLGRIFKDREGNIWVTSKQKGVFFLTAQERGASLLTIPESVDNAITNIAYEPPKLYLGNRAGSIYMINTTGKESIPVYEGGSPIYNDASAIKSMSKAPAALWFIRQSDGIFRLDLKSGEASSLSGMFSRGYELDASKLPKKIISPLTRINYLASVGKDIVWHEEEQSLIVGRGNFSYRCLLEPGQPARVEFMTFNRAYSITVDSSSTIWIGHDDGLGSFRNGEYTFHSDVSLLNGKSIWDLEVSADNVLWAGTDGYGLVAYNGKEAGTIKGTENDIIQDIFIENEESLWLATNYGVKQVRIARPFKNSRTVAVFDVNAGLATREANCVVADSQFVFVGTNEGLTRISRHHTYSDSTIPVLYLDSLRVNGLRYPVAEPISLSYWQNELELHFTALSYKSFGGITYEYQLEGADRQRQQATSRSVRYSKLPPGDYRFQLRAIDIQGLESALSPPIALSISPPWWKTPLAFILGGLAIMLIIGSVYLWRVRQIKRKAKREASISKQFAELELQALQSQMNPHFVFNSLGAIQYFIQSNEKELADDYLARFGHLMRLFLESSKNRYISLAEEIKILNLYIQLEQTRFRNKFCYQLNIGEELEPHAILIPSMLLQPFVENAINHGLFHKKGAGMLKIGLRAADKKTICTIEDNGIGREKAEQIRLRSSKSYKSRAMQITRERLKALKRFEDYNIDFTITDLRDKEGLASGTKVVIQIPEIE